MPILDDIADAAEALTDPHQHAEPRWEWDTNRHRKPLPPHITTMPGLIQQLRDMAEPGATGDDNGAQSVPGSRPPVSLDAVSLIAAISYGSARLLLDMQADPRGTPEGNIRALVGWAGRLDHDAQHDLRRDLRGWQHQAEAIAGWRDAAVELIAPCPAQGDSGVCGARGSLLAQVDETGARCTTCGTRWDETTIKGLFEHVRRHKAATDAKAAAAREVVRSAKVRARNEMAAARDRATRRRVAA